MGYENGELGENWYVCSGMEGNGALGDERLYRDGEIKRDKLWFWIKVFYLVKKRV